MNRAVVASEWRSHWRVAIGASLGLATGIGLFSYVSSLFIKPLEAAFGWSRGSQSLIFGAYMFAAFVAPVFGHWVDRRGIRTFALPCMLLLSAAYFALAMMNGAIGLYYALFVVTVFAGQGTGAIVFVRAVVSWFDRSRGMALAISRVSLSAAAAIVPPLLFVVIDRFGWRAGFATLGLLTLLIGCPATFFWVRERRDTSVAPGAHRPALGLLKNRSAVLICLAASLTIAPVTGFLSQLQPLLTDKGLSPPVAASAAGLLALSVLAGTLLTGALIDRIWAPLIGCIFTLVPAAGCLLLLSPAPPQLVALAAVMLVGFAQGAELDIIGYLIGRYLGVGSFGAMYGLVYLLMGIMAAISNAAFGLIHDRFGNYDPALIGAALSFVSATICYLLMQRFDPRVPALAQ